MKIKIALPSKSYAVQRKTKSFKDLRRFLIEVIVRERACGGILCSMHESGKSQTNLRLFPKVLLSRTKILIFSAENTNFL